MTKGEGCQKSQKIDDVFYERPFLDFDLPNTSIGSK